MQIAWSAVFSYLPLVALIVSVAALWVSLGLKRIQRANRHDKLIADIATSKTVLFAAIHEAKSSMNGFNSNLEIIQIELPRLSDRVPTSELEQEMKDLLSVGQEIVCGLEGVDSDLGTIHKQRAADQKTFEGLQNLSVSIQRMKLKALVAESRSVKTLALIRKSLERQ